MTIIQDFFDFCKRAGGTPKKREDGSVMCEVDRGKDYAYFELDSSLKRFTAALYNHRNNKLQLYSIESDDLEINPLDFSVCDENYSCILYEPAFFELGYGVNTQYGSVAIKTQDYTDYSGLTHTIYNCDLRLMSDGTPVELKCDIYNTNDLIMYGEMPRGEVNLFMEAYLGISEDISKKIKEKIEKGDVVIDYIRNINKAEVFNPGLLKTLRIVNELTKDEKFREYLSTLRDAGVNIVLGNTSDVARVRNTGMTPVGFFASKDKLMMISIANVNVRKDEDIKHTLFHETGHSLVYLKARATGKKIPAPRWVGERPVGEEEYAEKFAWRIRRRIPKIKEKLEALKYL